MRHVPLFLLAVSILLLGACPDEGGPKQAAPSRFQGVSSQGASKAARTVCEKIYPASGATAKTFQDPPEQPLTGVAKASAATGWRWINVWATWCDPCVEEIPLLERWSKALKADGLDVTLELWSADDDGDKLQAAVRKGLPGQVRWMTSSEALPGFLDQLGAAAGAALPVHALVDPKGQLRCVRVGAVHEGDFGSFKTVIAEM